MLAHTDLKRHGSQRYLTISISIIMLIVLALGLPASLVRAVGPATIVSDINRAPASARPTELTNVSGTLFFVIADSTRLAGLWRSDGSEAGTTQVKPFFLAPGGAPPIDLTAVGSTLFFVAHDGSGYQLWKSDGTETGTLPIATIRPGPATTPAPHFELTAVGTTLFFVTDIAGGLGLWKSDGTTAGTMRIKAMTPPFLYRPLWQFWLTSAHGQLFFVAADGASPSSLWKSDGTEIGTSALKPINLLVSRSGSIDPHLTAVGNALFFVAASGGADSGLWRSDGTSEGTQLIASVPRDRNGFEPSDLTDVGGTLFFTVRLAEIGSSIYGTLWKSDGTSAGTTSLGTIGLADGFRSFSYLLTNFHGTLFFVSEQSLWQSDGTQAGTRPVKLTGEPSADTYYPILDELVAVADTMFFVVYPGPSLQEAVLWRSDGTEAGTLPMRTVRHPPVGRYGSTARFRFTALHDVLLFAAYDPSHGEELWNVDALSDPQLVKDIATGTADAQLSGLTALQGALIVAQHDEVAETSTLWRSDGSDGGTVPLKRIVDTGALFVNCAIYNLTDVWGQLFFLKDGTDAGLWRSDGTSLGTRHIIGPLPYQPTCANQLARMNGSVFFTLGNGTVDQVWKSGGLATNTVRVSDRIAGPRYLTHVNDTLFFIANGDQPNQLWKSDGSDVGTVVVKPESLPGPSNLTNAAGTLFFSTSADKSTALWRSDGTAAGTIQLKGGFLEASSIVQTNVVELTAVGHTLFFVTDDGTSGFELWKSDGTAAGTVLVKDIRVGAQDSAPHSLTSVNGALFFVANDGTSGDKLWTSDGTEAGTARVKDINAGSAASFPEHLANIYGTLFFTAYDPQHGYELWKSDGHEAGTLLVQDIEPGPASSAPAGFTVAGSNLFFNATTTDFGRELWKMPITALDLRQPNLILRQGVGDDVVIENGSSVAATEVVFTRSVPVGHTFKKGSASQGTCTLTGPLLVCRLGSISGGGVVTVTTTITPPLNEDAYVIATATEREDDLDLGDNTLIRIFAWARVLLPYVTR